MDIRRVNMFDWQTHYELALNQRPEEEAGLAGVARSCPMAVALHLLSYRLDGRVVEWCARARTISHDAIAYETPAWARDAMRKVDIRGRGRPVSWGQWTAILWECQPPDVLTD